MLKLDGVHKKFKSALVAEQISVDLGPCTYGLLGRNGSGKTTLLRCITRVEKVNGGRIVYTDGDGREVKDYLDHIGYLPQNFDVFPELTAYEVLQFFANLKGYKITEEEIDHLLEILNLSPQRDMTVKTLSAEITAMIGVSAAIAISDIPWDGPISGVNVGLVDGQIVINPTLEQRAHNDLNLTVASTAGEICCATACP